MKTKLSTALFSATLVAATFTWLALAAAQPAQVVFTADAPCAVTVLVNSYTDPNNQPGQMTMVFTPWTLDTSPSTSVTFLYSTSVICGGTTYKFVSALPSSPLISGAAGSSITVVGHYSVAPVIDNTPPVWTTPANFSVEATGPSGAVVTYTATAADPDDAVSSQSCSPASGSTFALGTTTVNCVATDTRGNTGTASFSVTVVDTTPPTINVPANITTQATGSLGAVVTYSVSAHDLMDGAMTPGCSPASGSTFALGTTTVNCAATDTHGNTGAASFSVTVVDTTPPTINIPADIATPAIGPSGAVVTYSVSANDLVDGAITPSCSPASGSTFAVGTTVVGCTATDSHNNTAIASFNVTVTPDQVPPVLTLPSDITVNATSASGANVSFTATANDAVDGSVPVSCSPTSGSLFPIGQTTVNCSAADKNGNTSVGSFNVTVQKINAAPIANAGGPYLGAVNIPIAFDGSASFDPEADPLTYAWDFGDGAAGSGVMPQHAYGSAGIYTACLTVSDGFLNSTPACATVIVYDPNGGFVTGGGWFDSPAGALASDPNAAGKGHFGFVAKYHKDGQLESETEFNLQAGEFHFHARDARWLYIAGARAQFIGQGAVAENDHAYGFSVTVLDGDLTGGSDMFRIRIWDMDSGNAIVYDSQMGAPIYADPTAALGGGSIVIHKEQP